MKPWISKALVGLCLAAATPSLALLPYNKALGTNGVVLSFNNGLTSKQREMVKNSFGLWFQKMDAFRIVNDPSKPGYITTVPTTRIDGVNPKMCRYSDRELCAFNIVGNAINIYTKYTWKDGSTGSVDLSNEPVFQNMMTFAVGVLLSAKGTDFDNSGNPWPVSNAYNGVSDYYRYYSWGGSWYLFIPGNDACYANAVYTGVQSCKEKQAHPGKVWVN